jgi:hypothetical protein
VIYDVAAKCLFVKNAIEKRCASSVDVEGCKHRKNQQLFERANCRIRRRGALFTRAKKGVSGATGAHHFWGFIRGVVVRWCGVAGWLAGWVGNTTNRYTTIKRVFVMVSQNGKMVLRG